MGIAHRFSMRRSGIAVLGAVMLSGTWAFVGTVAADPTTHDVAEVRIENFIGTIEVEVGRGPVRLDITGPAEKTAKLGTEEEAGTLVIEGEDRKRDWRRINRKRGQAFPADQYPKISIRAPKGTTLTVEEAAGLIEVGNLGGAVELDEVSLDGSFGDVKSASVEITGRGKLKFGDVDEGAKIVIAGSGDVEMGDVGADSAFTIAGSGDIRIADIRGGLNAAIHGRGDARVQSVNGSVSVAINGAGDIRIMEGRADPLKVAINGAGDFTFGGTAVNPQVAINGSGDVTIERYEGDLQRSGRGRVKINAQP